MAHLMKFTRSSVRGILQHDERNKDTSKQYKNIDIDLSKTDENYSYLDNKLALDRFNERLKNVEIYNRPDVKVLCSWVVTLPKEIKQEDERKFFDYTFEFLSEKYGKNNIISADVHKDETSPHLHFTFVPVVENKKKNAKFPEKVSSKEILTQTHLKKFHTELDNFLTKKLGYSAGIINGATKQNKTIGELKKETENELNKLKNISEIKEKTGIFGKVLISAEEYKTLKNGAKEIKELTEDYINSKNGERLKNVLTENENLKKENAQLKEFLVNKDERIDDLREQNRKAKKEAKETAEKEVRDRLKTLEDENTRLHSLVSVAKTLINKLMGFADAYRKHASMDKRVDISQAYLQSVQNGFIDHDQYVNEKPKSADIQITKTKGKGYSR